MMTLPRLTILLMLSEVQIAQQSAVAKITSLLRRVFPTSRSTAFGHKMSWRVTYVIRYRDYNTFFILKSSAHEIYLAHKC